MGQKETVVNLMADLKKIGIAASKVESDLKIASGYLWKVKEGRKNLSKETMNMLIAYHNNKIVRKPDITVPVKEITKSIPQKPEFKNSTTKSGSLSLASYLGPRPSKPHTLYKRIKQ